MDRVLVVAAHPDDEVLGCGGTIARHTDKGDDAVCLIVAEGATARESRRNSEAQADDIAALQAAAGGAAKALGAAQPRFLGLADNRLDALALLDIVKPIEAAIAELRPTIVYTHHGGDLNVDHRLVHQAVMTACRPLPGSTVRGVYAFETVSSSEWAAPQAANAFLPNHFVDISAQLDRKLAALAYYKSEMRPYPHPRSDTCLSALAKVRGACCGVSAAEAFMVLRQIES